MNLVKFNTNPVFSGIMNEFDRNFFRNGDRNVELPAVNIIEEDKRFVLEMAAP